MSTVMSATSTSGSAAGATSEEIFRLSTSMDSTELTESSNSTVTQALPSSSGNPRIEEIRGIMHLYRDDNNISSSPNSNLPLICVLAVPNHMTYADFCRFCGSFIQHILEMRIVRNDGVEDQYSVLIIFDGQESADNFYKHFNGKRFSSMEVEICHVLFTVDVQFTASIEHAHTSPASSTEQPSCPVCLEILDQEMGGILTTICNHSFHCSCISKWTDSSCPIVDEYKDLLTSQLENQRTYFEALLLEAKEKTEREISESVDKAVKLQKLQSKLDKHMEEMKFLDELRDLIAYIEAENTEEQVSTSSETVLKMPAENTEEQVSTSSETVLKMPSRSSNRRRN
ncbi:hypothetical protein MKX01_025974 [Papaver californicum]|nr:hypothetical protein MKX01_025974 [Papaver californicum]